MTLQDIFSAAGVLIGLAGLAYAKYQSIEKLKLQNAICAQAWSLYAKSNNASGNMQLALSTYKKCHSNSFKPEVLEALAKADAFSQDVFKDTIKHINFSEPSFTAATVEKWVEEGRIAEKHKEHFMLLVPTNNSALSDKK